MCRPNPTALVNLDFETGDFYAWRITNREAGFSAAISSPGHVRSGVNSKYGVAVSKEAGPINGYGFSEVQQAAPNLQPGQTYRVEFSWKYTVDVDSSDVCNTFVNFWGIQLAQVQNPPTYIFYFIANNTQQLTPSTTHPNLKDRGRHFLVNMAQCGNSLTWTPTLQLAQNPGEWRRYITYFRAPYPNSYKQVGFGLHCTGGTQAAKQTVYFDDWVVTPVPAC